jgi:sortase (surface protein transpeptidase)
MAIPRAGRIAAAIALAGMVISGTISGSATAEAAVSATHRELATHHKPVADRKPVAQHKLVTHRKPPTHRKAAPVSAAGWELNIPSIGVATKMLTLGEPHGGQLQVPTLAQAETAAWYRFTAVPGTPGNAVIVGHVDTYAGPGVFYDLYLLRPGNTIHVDVSGKQQDFTVRSVTELPKPQFPVNRIFGGTSARRLWLITCGGAFDYATRHYLDNIIVSAVYLPSHTEHHSQRKSPPVAQRARPNSHRKHVILLQ